MMTRICLILFALTGLTGLSAPAGAQTYENIERLEGDLVAVLGAAVGTPGGPARPVDRRLKLAACPQRPAFDTPVAGAVAIRCAATGWRIHVPLMRAAGTVPQPRIAAFSAAPAAAEPAVDTTPVVRRGDLVTLIAGGRGFTVSQAGTAEQDGPLGGRIRVRTDPRKAAIIAEVTGPGEVRRAGLK